MANDPFFPKTKPVYIVTRHLGLVEFIKKYYLKDREFKVIPHLDEKNMPHDSVVIGVFPVHIIAELRKKHNNVYVVILPQLPPEYRGKELTPQQMKQFGARLVKVNSIKLRWN